VLHGHHTPFDDGVQVRLREDVLGLPGEGQQVLHDLAAASRLRAHHLGVTQDLFLVLVGELGLGQLALDQLGVDQDATQGVVQLVGNGRGQLAQRRHLLHVDDVALSQVELARLLRDGGGQLLLPLLAARACGRQIRAHLVEGLG
jgi:hypothetical protein